MESGWDPEVKKYFIRILNSISLGMLWLMGGVTAGLYFKLAYTAGKPLIYPILFYTGMFVTLLLLLRYYYRIWRR
jgi:hypothetical protein